MIDLNELLTLWTESGVTPSVDKYSAVRAEVVASVVHRLDQTDRNAADVMRWLCWWVQHHQNGCRWREKMMEDLIAEKLKPTTATP